MCWDGKDHLITGLEEEHGWQRGMRVELVSTREPVGRVLAIAWVVETMSTSVAIHIMHQRPESSLTGAVGRIIGAGRRARLEHMYAVVRSVEQASASLELDLGEGDGVQRGMIYEVRKQDDPDRLIGQVQIQQLYGQSSVARMITEKERIKPGDELVFLRHDNEVVLLGGNILVHDFTSADMNDPTQAQYARDAPGSIVANLRGASTHLYAADQIKRVKKTLSTVAEVFDRTAEELEDVIIGGETRACGAEVCTELRVRRGADSPALPIAHKDLLLGYLALALGDNNLASYYLRTAQLPLGTTKGAGPSIGASVLIDLARAEQENGQSARAQHWAREAISLAADRDELDVVRAGMLELGKIAKAGGEVHTLRTYVREARKMVGRDLELRHMKKALEYQLAFSRGDEPSSDDIMEAAAAAEQDGDIESARVLYDLSSEMSQSKGEPAEALAAAERSRVLASRLGLCAFTHHHARDMANLKIRLGDHEGAHTLMRAPEVCSGARQHEPDLLALDNLRALRAGVHEQRAADLRREADLLSRSKQKRRAGLYDYYRGLILLHLGDTGSRDSLERARKNLQKFAPDRYFTLTLVALAQYHLRTTDLRKARELLEKASAQAAQAANRGTRLEVYRSLIALELQEGHLGRAGEHLYQARDLLDVIDDPLVRADLDFFQGVAQHESDPTKARRSYEKSRAKLDREAEPIRWGLATRQLALLDIAADLERAHQGLVEANAAFDSIHDVPNALRTKLYLLWVSDVMAAKHGPAGESQGRKKSLSQTLGIMKDARQHGLDRLIADAHQIAGCLYSQMSRHQEGNKEFMEANKMYGRLGVRGVSQRCVGNNSPIMPGLQW